MRVLVGTFQVAETPLCNSKRLKSSHPKFNIPHHPHPPQCLTAVRNVPKLSLPFPMQSYPPHSFHKPPFTSWAQQGVKLHPSLARRGKGGAAWAQWVRKCLLFFNLLLMSLQVSGSLFATRVRVHPSWVLNSAWFTLHSFKWWERTSPHSVQWHTGEVASHPFQYWGDCVMIGFKTCSVFYT